LNIENWLTPSGTSIYGRLYFHAPRRHQDTKEESQLYFLSVFVAYYFYDLFGLGFSQNNFIRTIRFDAHLPPTVLPAHIGYGHKKAGGKAMQGADLYSQNR